MRYPGFSSSALAARKRSSLATCFRDGGILVASVLASGVLGFATPAQAKPAPCQGGRYVLKDKFLVVGPGNPAVDTVIMSGKSLSTGSGCGLVNARVRATKKGTKVRAKFVACRNVVGRAILRAKISTDCTTMTGIFTAKKSRIVKKPFTASLSKCGDDVLDADAGEQCDGTEGGSCPGSCDACRCPHVVTSTSSPTTTSSSSTSSSSTSSSSTSTSSSSSTSTTLHGSQAFGFIKAGADFMVPSGVTQVTIYATGAQGGNGGGRGGAVTAILPVTPGEVLVIGVGGAGGQLGEPGYNGGGWGGLRVGDSYLGIGGGGGGASDVRQGGGALENRVVVAAGGGGGMGGNVGVFGGNGGGLTGQPGQGASGWGGGGGTQTEGGVGGGMVIPICAGVSGSLGVGGDGAFWGNPGSLCSLYGGGGGGGGYYGGGGAGATGGPGVGVSSGGGGGGSSYAGPSATDVVHGLAPSGLGSVVISW